MLRVRFVRSLSHLLLCLVVPGTAYAAAPAAPQDNTIELKITRPGSEDTMAINRRVRIAAPPGWTGELEGLGRAVRLYGPEGEGKMLIAAALHPSELGYYLNELKREHPSAAPSPPEMMKLPGIRPSMGERATRFKIKGREVGEMALIEKRDTIVLIVTVVDPNAWPRVRKALSKTYPSIAINDVKR